MGGRAKSRDGSVGVGRKHIFIKKKTSGYQYFTVFRIEWLISSGYAAFLQIIIIIITNINRTMNAKNVRWF